MANSPSKTPVSATAALATSDKGRNNTPAPQTEVLRNVCNVLGPWRLGKRIAVGSMAEVFQARPVEAKSEQTDRYALKRLLDRWQETPAALAQFRREAFVGRRVNDPHVVAILAAQVDRPPYYLVMPRLEGITLDTQLEARTPQPLAVALWIARQIAEGVAALHDVGWLHGDIKPANVLVSPTGHVTLLDLGSVCPLKPDARPSNAAPLLAGTPAYLAPEVLTSTLAYSPQADVYSLGVVLFELLAGARPYLTEDVGELVRQHREGNPPLLKDRAPHVPEDVATVVERMLARQPLRRPGSMHTVRDQLLRLEVRHLANRTLPRSFIASGETVDHWHWHTASNV